MLNTRRSRWLLRKLFPFPLSFFALRNGKREGRGKSMYFKFCQCGTAFNQSLREAKKKRFIFIVTHKTMNASSVFMFFFHFFFACFFPAFILCLQLLARSCKCMVCVCVSVVGVTSGCCFSICKFKTHASNKSVSVNSNKFNL